MKDRFIPRLAAAVTVAALAVSGCASRNEVGGINLVNCEAGQGPRSGEIKYPLINVGDRLSIGGTGETGFGHVSSIIITLKDNNSLSVTDSNPNGEIRYFPTSDTPRLEDGQVGTNSSGTIFANSMGIDYQVKSEISNGGASLDVTAT